jgi:hypothetical protein
MNPLKGNKDKGQAGQEPGEFIWSGIPEPWAQSQPSLETAAGQGQRPGSGAELDPDQGPAPESPPRTTPPPAAVYEFGFAGSGSPQPVHAEVRTAASVGVLPAPASSSSSPSPSPGATVPLPGYASPSRSVPAASAAPSVRTSTTEPAKAVVEPTPSVAPTTPASSSPITITTPSPEVTATAATNISGSIQCESTSVEGVWIQSANGGSGWAPWVSSAARSYYATYSYTLPKGGEYSVHVGCGGTTSSWKVAEYSNFYGGTVNDFYCYDESSSSLYTYCARTS